MKNVPILVKLAFWGKRQKNVKLLSITHLPSRGDEGPGETTWHHSREDEDVGRGHGERGRHIKREARPDLDEKEERSEGGKRRSLVIAREGTAWRRGQQALPGVGCGQGRGQSSRAQSCKAPGCAGPSGRGLANSCTILIFLIKCMCVSCKTIMLKKYVEQKQIARLSRTPRPQYRGTHLHFIITRPPLRALLSPPEQCHC